MKSHPNRRSFLGAAGALLGASFWADETLDAAVQNVNRNSNPSDLKITDLRVAMVKAGPNDVPDHPHRYQSGNLRAGRGPRRRQQELCAHVEEPYAGRKSVQHGQIFRKIKQFGGHARQGGGVCGIEMALWDLAGKAYNVPVYQMLGGKFRDKIRCYADTTESQIRRFMASV